MTLHPAIRPTRTTCAYCGVGCGVLATPDGQGGLAIAGDPDHPANFGRLCVKGAALGETVGLGARLLAPRIHGAEAGWDQALDLVAQGQDIDYVGASAVELVGPGESAGTYREVDFKGGTLNAVKTH